ncbi:MAG: hypothetical protein ACJ8DV_19685 [Microvirga sp.]
MLQAAEAKIRLPAGQGVPHGLQPQDLLVEAVARQLGDLDEPTRMKAWCPWP